MRLVLPDVSDDCFVFGRALYEPFDFLPPLHSPLLKLYCCKSFTTMSFHCANKSREKGTGYCFHTMFNSVWQSQSSMYCKINPVTNSFVRHFSDSGPRVDRKRGEMRYDVQ